MLCDRQPTKGVLTEIYHQSDGLHSKQTTGLKQQVGKYSQGIREYAPGFRLNFRKRHLTVSSKQASTASGVYNVSQSVP